MIYLFYGLITAMVWLLSAGAPQVLSDDPKLAAQSETTEATEAQNEERSESVDADQAVQDARRFFELLVERYRGLTSYSDLSRIVQVIQHAGEAEPRRVETEMSSEVADGALRTETAWTQIRRTFGLNLPLPSSQPMDRTELRYQLWMLPHLTLKFSDEPLRDFRDGVLEGFTATDLASVTVDDRPLVHLELRSGDGTADDASARFDLYVDPDSMLIERIRGEQRLPDGGNYETTVDITPREHQSVSNAVRPAYTGWPIRKHGGVDGDEAETEEHETDGVKVREPNEAPDKPEPYPLPVPDPCPPAAEPGDDDDVEPSDAPRPNPAPRPTPTPLPIPSPGQSGDPQPDHDVPAPTPPRSESPSDGQSDAKSDVPSRPGTST